MRNAWILARLTFKEAARRRVLLAALVFGLLFLAVYSLGLYFLLRELQADAEMETILARNTASNLLVMAGMYVVNFLTVMMTVLTSVDTISGEIASGVVHTMLSKPVQRWEIVLGKWLGFLGMISLYLLLMAGGVLLSVYLQTGGYTVPNAIRGVGLLWLNAAVLLTLSLWGGVRLSTIANGVLVFGMFGVSFIGGWIEQIGGFLPNPATQVTAMRIGVVTSLLLPTEALWKRAAYEMQSPLMATFGVSPFTSRSVPSGAMIVYAVLYAAVLLVLTMRHLRARDL